MLGTLTILLLCQLAGELIARVAHLPVPGPVLGMLILFAGLMLRGGVPNAVQETAGGILRHLSLLFIPAGVGVMAHMERLGAEALPIVVALFGSTLFGVAVTAKVMAALVRPTPDAETSATEDRP
ncbi:CidA/LrgA family protein [Azospirillum doebereinerae]|uniref:CidA/LrgA family protein n=1 Tax=Azospirillum doebereinerae TaxID=92933 RepID=A0A433JBW4_9PROT|nr:CidA/LrgA family protein [Azospirillum doebereinerae]MCG5239675.1 CidA/LrgA family protein [Azospirillum doebereinerae]RUQ74092.1 CidA/LrgA family protein [Azospirillum doebereinerae]